MNQSGQSRALGKQVPRPARSPNVESSDAEVPLRGPSPEREKQKRGSPTAADRNFASFDVPLLLLWHVSLLADWLGKGFLSKGFVISQNSSILWAGQRQSTGKPRGGLLHRRFLAFTV